MALRNRVPLLPPPSLFTQIFIWLRRKVYVRR